MIFSETYWINLIDDTIIGLDTGAVFRRANMHLCFENGRSAIKLIKIGAYFGDDRKTIEKYGLLERHILLKKQYAAYKISLLQKELEALKIDFNCVITDAGKLLLSNEIERLEDMINK